MWIQKINDFKSQNPQTVVPEWFSDIACFNWVYIWNKNWKISITWRCEQMNQDWIIIKNITNQTSLSCINLLENWDCSKSWDWREWFLKCKIHEMLNVWRVSS